MLRRMQLTCLLCAVAAAAAAAAAARLKELDDAQLRDVVGGLLGSFKSLAFYPDCTQALLVAGRLNASAMGPAENALMADVESAVSGPADFECGIEQYGAMSA
jgi:hypothetical protein